MKKKLLALVCALALTVSLVGCALSTPDTVGKIGDFEVTSGLYLLAQYDAYQQAAQLADSEQDTSKVNSFLKATITTDADTGETAVVKDYVAQKTLETLQTLAAVDARFTELGGELTEEQKSAADSYAQQLMDNYGDAYTANGIGLETLKLFQQLQYKHTLLLDLVYGKDGETPVEDGELTEHLDSTMYEIGFITVPGSLLWVLDKTKTAMGARLLRSYVEQPLIDKAEIEKRQDAIADINKHMITREELREYLNPIYDLERLITRVTYMSANPRDLIAFKNSIGMLPPIKTLLEDFDTELLKELQTDMDPLEELYQLIDASIMEEPPISVREGGLIKDGYNENVDKYRHAKTEGKTWLAELEAKEREKTGIKNLKIKFNKVFGYYLEVTNSYRDLVPDYFTRKQTLANAERYITPELKELEDMILGAEDKLINLEYDLFCEVRNRIAAEVVRIQKTAKAVAKLDTFVSLAVVADQNNYCRPKINENGVIDIKDGRHPVVEKMMNNDMFIANDTYLDNGNNRISIITGPNMAGKSTYMRQTAIIVLMAQIGSFVPASSAKIGIVDRIFTRVGASDDLASGQSTFMVEMNEVANILRNATSNSLLVLDEIGRGTSTFDGLSIAWAVVEHISNPKLLGAKTLFATHYHELTELEGKLHNVNNYCIAVKEKGDDIVFLRKIVRGGADKSYGIQVAKLAGVPDSVIERAKQIVEELSANDITAVTKNLAVETGTKKKKEKLDEVDLAQMSLFDTVKDDDILEELKNVDLSNMTPIDALNKLYELQNKIKNRW